MAGGGRQWLGGGGGGGRLGGGGAGFCDPSATSSAVLFRSWVGASAAVHRQSDSVRDGVLLVLPLLCTETGTHSAFLLAGLGVLQYIDKVVDVGNAVALWRLVKEFHIFSTCSRCSLGIWTLFP